MSAVLCLPACLCVSTAASRGQAPHGNPAELQQGGGRPPGEVAGAWGGKGSELEVLERRWRGMGVEDAHGRRGELEAWWGSWREEDVDMGWRWRAWQRPGERERRWRMQGVEVAYKRRGERETRCCSRGEGDVDMGQLWRAWWRPGEQERQERGPEGSWWRLGEQERRE